MVKMIALNMLVSNASTYYHNYYMYHDLKKDKWTMFPWDLDNTFWESDISRQYQTGNNSDLFNSEMPGNLFFERAIACPEILKDIRNEIINIHKTVFNVNYLSPVIEDLKKQLSPYMAMDKSMAAHHLAEWDMATTGIKKYIRYPDGKEISYKVWYNQDPNYDRSKTKEIKNLSDTTFTITEKLKKGRYFWKVFAVDEQFEVPGFDNSNSFNIEN